MGCDSCGIAACTSKPKQNCQDKCSGCRIIQTNLERNSRSDWIYCSSLLVKPRPEECFFKPHRDHHSGLWDTGCDSRNSVEPYNQYKPSGNRTTGSSPFPPILCAEHVTVRNYKALWVSVGKSRGSGRWLAVSCPADCLGVTPSPSASLHET